MNCFVNLEGKWLIENMTCISAFWDTGLEDTEGVKRPWAFCFVNCFANSKGKGLTENILFVSADRSWFGHWRGQMHRHKNLFLHSKQKQALGKNDSAFHNLRSHVGGVHTDDDDDK